MRHRNLTAALFAVLLMLNSGLYAEVVPGKWEKVDALTAGIEIEVKLKTGDRIDCAFKNSEPDNLSVMEPNGNVRMIPKSEVETIVSRSKYNDSGKDNGTGESVAEGVFCTGDIIGTDHA